MLISSITMVYLLIVQRKWSWSKIRLVVSKVFRHKHNDAIELLYSLAKLLILLIPCLWCMLLSAKWDSKSSWNELPRLMGFFSNQFTAITSRHYISDWK